MPRPHRLAALVLACASGCAHVDRGPGSPPALAVISGGASPVGTRGAAVVGAGLPVDPGAARLAEIRAQVDAFLRAQGALLWETWTRGAAPDLEPVLAAHATLFSRETVLFVRDARDRASGDEARALSLLHAFLVGEHLSRAGDAGGDVAGPVVAWNGERVATARAPALLAAESAPQRRAALARAWAEAEQQQDHAARSRRDAMGAAARALGYPSLTALGAELRGESPDALSLFAEGVLTATDATYRSLIDALGRSEMNRPLAELRGCDLPRLFRSGDERRLFPADRAGSDARSVLTAVGLDIGARPAVIVDDGPRPGKDPRALTLPVEVPADVRCSFTPGGGVSEMRGLLHEVAAAAFYSRVGATRSEFRRLGSITAETWSRLFADLTGEPRWLAERTGAADHELAPIVRANAARRLHRARLLAVRVVDEVARHRDPKRAGTMARARLERAMLRPVTDDELQLFVLDRDPLLQSADELRALLLAAQAESFLSLRAGTAWWRSSETGAWLAGAFAEGSRLSPAELAHALGAEKVDAAALVESTRARVAAAGLRLVASP